MQDKKCLIENDVREVDSLWYSMTLTHTARTSSFYNR